jgi:predicted metal-dependent enzyme (double-stranded beta helix superfamily)
LSDAPGKEVLMLTVDYAPGAADPVHRHDARGFIYVLEGPRDVHTVGRNASRTQPARFLVFILKDKGKPALIPVGCP